MPAGIIHRHCPETKKALDPVSSVSSSRPSSTSASPVAGFGTNEWLVEEMYQQYVADPSSVDQAWHEFFADYRPGSPLGGGDAAANGQQAPAKAPEQKAPAPPAQQAPEAKAPEVKAPEKAAPAAAPAPAPAAKAVEAPAPETKAPATATPDTKAPAA